MRLFPSQLLLGVALCGALLAPSLARADAFSPIPVGDPIYRQLDALASLNNTKATKGAATLTRYEVAIQVARAATVSASRPNALSRSGWRSLRDLAIALRVELRQLGVDVEDVLASCDRQLDAQEKPTLPAPASQRSFKSGSGSRVDLSPPVPSFLNGPSSPATLGVSRTSLGTNALVPLLGSVRVSAATSALKRSTFDPLFDSENDLQSRPNSTRVAGKDASVSLKLNSWLRLKALASERQLNVGPDTPPALTAPLFTGASEAQGMGGGFEFSPTNWLRFSTEVERLSTDTGAQGTKVGGGLGLSAWQNRLTLAAYVSRLQPEDSAQLITKASELHLGLNMTQRLSLNVLYQQLFSSQSESSRLAGGLNFSF